MIHGKKNFLSRIVKTAESTLSNRPQRIVDIIDSAIRTNVTRDPDSDGLFDMLDTLRAAVNEAIDKVNSMSKSATIVSKSENKTGQRQGYYAIVPANKGSFNGIILNLKFYISTLCLNQLRDIMDATQKYSEITHGRHQSLDFFIADKANYIKTDAFSFVFNRHNWENPAFFAYSNADAPFLSSSRRVLLVL